MFPSYAYSHYSLMISYTLGFPCIYDQTHMHVYYTHVIWWFPKMGVPPNQGLSLINHSFWKFPSDGKHHVSASDSSNICTKSPREALFVLVNSPFYHGFRMVFAWFSYGGGKYTTCYLVLKWAGVQSTRWEDANEGRSAYRVQQLSPESWVGRIDQILKLINRYRMVYTRAYTLLSLSLSPSPSPSPSLSLALYVFYWHTY